MENYRKTMNSFEYKNNQLTCEDVKLTDLVQKYGTPLYVYSYSFLQNQFRRFTQAFASVDHLICYSMKANSNRAILRTFIKEGSGIDVVTGGELKRAVMAGCTPDKIVFAGVGKNVQEIRAGIELGILQFNVESIEELHAINAIGESLNRRAPIALRVNPDVDPKTHAYISTGLKKSKFGITRDRAIELYKAAHTMKGVEIVGIDCHIGSQLTDSAPMVEALKKVLSMVDELAAVGIKLKNLDIGGGLGITYKDETPPTPEAYAAALLKELGSRPLRLILEPGRFLVGNSGALITQVIYNKDRDNKKFVIVDAASNDLMRPMLYGAYHAIQPVVTDPTRETIKADIVGPICETGDFFAQDRDIQKVFPGEQIALMSAGAYGFAMASNYNSRPRPAEVMVKGSEVFVINKRETLDEISAQEQVPGFLS